jgi:hypothetical protein
MEQEIKDLKELVKAQDAKLDALYASAEKMRKYFLIVIWITVLGFLLPLAGAMFTLPSLMETVSGTVNEQGY